MSIIVYIECFQKHCKKPSIEAICYGKKIAQNNHTELIVVCNGTAEKTTLKKYGADKILFIKTKNLNSKITALIKLSKTQQGKVIILEQNANGKYIAPVLAAKLNAGYVSNVIGLPTDDFIVKRTVFSNKAFQFTKIEESVKILTIKKNNINISENEGAGKILQIETEEATTEKIGLEKTAIELLEEKKQDNRVSISDADVVVSGGRGLKGSENWHLIENLAQILGGAVACSKPVSDMGWRPHSEHVGQTGKPVNSHLYIAIGISGAIQHLAGVNAAKIKIVINNDPEAPFFKAADYGIIGDAFEIVPELTKKLTTQKNN